MRISLRMRPSEPAATATTIASGMILADVMTLPAVTDLISAGKALGIGRTRSYQLARAGSFPCRVERAGRIYLVPTASLLAVLGMTVPCTNCSGEKGR
jgi:hypothetical protein